MYRFASFCRAAGALMAFRLGLQRRLLGHWGATPGLNFLYVHWNRVIREQNLDMIYVIGPGHGGPGRVANTYLEGSYSEIYPNIEQNKDGIKRLFKHGPRNPPPRI
jgi:xylulose-5-phosphate/fructose-6-phosphate phosphoketolase